MRGGTEAVPVAEEEDALALSLSALAGLDPVAHASRVPKSAQEADRATLSVRSVVLAHNRLDRLGRLVGVVEGNGGDIVVQDVGFDDTVKKTASNEAELAIDRGSCSTRVGPGVGVVVGKSRVSVLKEGNGN